MGETQVTVLPGQHLWATYAITYIEWWPTIDEKKITVMATHANMKQLGNTGGQYMGQYLLSQTQ